MRKTRLQDAAIVSLLALLAGFAAIASPSGAADPEKTPIPALQTSSAAKEKPQDAQTGSATSVAVPAGKGAPVITDGLFSPGEWDDALRIPIRDSVALYLKEHQNVVFLGIRGEGNASVGPSELFLASPGGPIHKLHVSFQLFEQKIEPGSAEPPIRFGLTPDWYASEFRRDVELAERMQKEGKDPREIMRSTSYPSDGIEFAIRRSKFPGKTWLLRLWISALLENKPSALSFPQAAAEKTTDGWMELHLK